MANNRVRFVGVDDNGEIKDECYFAKHCSGEWYMPTYVDAEKQRDNINDFFERCFFNQYGIALTDEYTDEPLKVVYHYNGKMQDDRSEEIVRCRDCKYFYCLTIDACVCKRNGEDFMPWVEPNGFCSWGKTK